ncbi:calcyphosin-like protein [Dreissena polymorpha]|uniref:calcyphosin-like protein n=1 Tax=Dreissena polymorpha TaxID=45954 RepID=UPI002264121E|nr:calcyphosin-like protein [Dreissena polymorpha]
MPETVESLIRVLREQCLQGGCNGVKALSVVFRAMDIDYSKRIVYDELRDALQRFGIQMSENYLRTLFDALDVNKSGGIDFKEFIMMLRPPMNHYRTDVINEAFNRLDVNNNGAICIEDLKGWYCSYQVLEVKENHPC